MAFTVSKAQAVEGASGTFILTFDAPVAVDTVVTIAVTGGTASPSDFLVPGSVIVLAGQTSSSFGFSTSADIDVEGTETVTLSLTDGVTTQNTIGYILDNDGPAPALWVNEIDYDQVGTDAASFIEIAGRGSIDFTDYEIVLYNGANGTAYQTIDLAAAGTVNLSTSSVVVRNPGVDTGPNAVNIDVAGDFIQNGAPDGWALVRKSDGSVLEFFSYEGTFTAINGPAQGLTSLSLGPLNVDSTSKTYSISRTVDGWSSDVADFVYSVPTPGAPNIERNGSFLNPLTVYGQTGTFSIAALDALKSEGNAGATDFTFTVTRDLSDGAADVNWALNLPVGAGKAVLADFTGATSGTVSFADGETSKTLTVQIQGDLAHEADETFGIVLQSAGLAYGIGSGRATGTILNDDVNAAPTAVALINARQVLLDDTTTATRVKVADIAVTDDDVGTNALTVTGTDAAFFEIVGTELFLKAGTTLDYATKRTYSVVVTVDDAAVGVTPDATSQTYTLNLAKPAVHFFSAFSMPGVFDVLESGGIAAQTDSTVFRFASVNGYFVEIIGSNFHYSGGQLLVDPAGDVLASVIHIYSDASYQTEAASITGPDGIIILSGTGDVFPIDLKGVVSARVPPIVTGSDGNDVFAPGYAPNISRGGTFTGNGGNDTIGLTFNPTDPDFPATIIFHGAKADGTGMAVGEVNTIALFGGVFDFRTSTFTNINRVEFPSVGGIVTTFNSSQFSANGMLPGTTFKGGAIQDVLAIGMNTVTGDFSGLNFETWTAATDTVKFLDTGAANVALNYHLTRTTDNFLASTHTAAIIVDGGAGNDLIETGSGADTLNGGLGADTLRGRGGNDTYVIDNAGDVADELVAGSSGVADLVKSSISCSLSDAVHARGAIENLSLLAGAINGTGNALGNIITGNAVANTLSGLAGNDTLSGLGGNDTINGGLGNDRLTGGANSDFFVFNTKLSGTLNRDTITDFFAPQDTMRLENTGIFSALGAATGTLSAAKYWASTTGVAHDADDRIIYNKLTGVLTYDSNGSAAGGVIQFAVLTAHPAITNADFFVI